jgi:predicted transposase YbfD/YdcC
MSAPETAESSPVGHFSVLEDPRDALRCRHHLLDMVVIAIAGTLGGADGWVDIAQFGRAKEAWFRRFLDLPNGIPSHDTFGRVFSLLAPEAFETCFRAWVASIRTVIPGEIIAVDGKTLRRSHDRGKGVAALHLVSAWATANRVVLGQVATDAKSNAITAIPELLGLLMREGAIVTIDAMGCRTKIAAQIIDQGGNDVLALKGNQGVLAAEVEEAFIEADAKDYREVDSEALDTVERGHGRVETRRYRTLGDLSGVPRSALWKGMNRIGRVESTRESDGKVSRETRFFIGSIGTGVADFGRAVRGHLGCGKRAALEPRCGHARGRLPRARDAGPREPRGVAPHRPVAAEERQHQTRHQNEAPQGGLGRRVPEETPLRATSDLAVNPSIRRFEY